MIYVTKADGSRQIFDKQKVMRTCLRLRATPEAAQRVANKIESKLYEGIRTKEILRMIFRYMKEYRPAVKYQTDLREAIAIMRPRPDFEKYVALLLREQGYQVKTNLIIQGKCVEHEVDVVAKKGNEIVYVEVKHHFQHHTFTGLGIFLQAWASYVDLLQGYDEMKNPHKFNKVMLVCNTKMSDHAKRYATCKGMLYLTWNHPPEKSMGDMVREKSLYPITLIKNLDRRIEAKLGDVGVITLKQLVESDIAELSAKANIDRQKLKMFVAKAKEILA